MKAIYNDDGNTFSMENSKHRYKTFTKSGGLSLKVKDLIKKGDLSPPEGYVVKNNKVLKSNDDKFTQRKLTLEEAKLQGFHSLKEMKEFVKTLKNQDISLHSISDLRKMSKAFTTFNELTTIIPKKVSTNVGGLKFKAIRDPSPFNNELIFDIHHTESSPDYDIYLNKVKNLIYSLMTNFLNKHISCKFEFKVYAYFVKEEVADYKPQKDDWNVSKYDGGGKKMIRVGPIEFGVPLTLILDHHEVRAKVDGVIRVIKRFIDEFLKHQSGWIFEKMSHSRLLMIKYQANHGGSFMVMDDYIRRKKAVRNIHNHNDDACMYYAVVSCLHADEIDFDHPKNSTHLTQFQKYFNIYGFDVNCPPFVVNKTNISKLESIIKRNINVYYYEHNSSVCPRCMYASDNKYITDNLDVLLVNDNGKHHFVWISHLSRLIGSKHSHNERKKHICRNCSWRFGTEDEMLKHRTNCMNHETCEISMVKDNEADLYFKNTQYMVSLPLIYYADAECFNQQEALDVGDDITRMTNPNMSDGIYTEKITEHIPSGFAYVSVSNIPDNDEEKGSLFIRDTFIDSTADCVDKFLDNLVKDCWSNFKKYFQKPQVDVNDIMTDEDTKQFEQSDICHICKKGGFVSKEENRAYFNKNGKPHSMSKTRDHCHFRDKYRGAAHNKCNQNYKVKALFPVFFHNLKGYDSHLIIQKLSKKYGLSQVSCIPLSTRKFLSFSLKFFHNIIDKNGQEKTVQAFEIRFLDSISFMNSSLEKIAQNLTKDDFGLMRQMIDKDYAKGDQHKLNEMMDLICKKGVYPYEYMDSFERFKETSLPSVKQFTSKLKYGTSNWRHLNGDQRKQLRKDKDHFDKVHHVFGSKNLKDDHDLYLKSDIYLLACVFEKFRQKTLEKFELDPCHYLSLPGCAWDSMLKMTGVHLHLFTEAEREMFLMIENGKIGGISTIGGKSYAVANHKYLKDFNPEMTKQFLMFLDANGLYAWAMSQKLPIDSFMWVECKDFNLEKALADCDGHYGYFIEGDFMCPNQHHDSQNDYPCFPENKVVTNDMLSPLMKKEREFLETNMNIKCPEESKLIPNLHPKTDYVVHINALKLYLEQGWEVVNIKRVLKFRQCAWMKPYIDLCMEERKKATDSGDDFGKQFFKDMANIVYGKTMENVRNRINMELVVDENRLQKLVNKPTIKHCEKINHEGLHTIQLSRLKLTLNKPIYVGVAVLNLSKYLMYDFFYNTLRVLYPTCRMIYTDTDSLLVLIETEDVYKDIRDHKLLRDTMDLSNFPVNHPVFEGMSEDKIKDAQVRNQRNGAFKCEMKGKYLKEVVCLKSKMYSAIDDDEYQKSTAKGVNAIIQSELRHDNYKRCKFHNYNGSDMVQRATMFNFTVDSKHNIFLTQMRKTTLSCSDDKRYYLDNGIDTLAHGHFQINKL